MLRVIGSLLVVLFFIAARPVAGQVGNGTIRYTHGPGSGQPSAVTYQPPGGTDRSISNGQSLTLRQGASICMAIGDANPLLYDYTLKADTVKLEPPDGLADFVKALSEVVTSVGRSFSSTSSIRPGLAALAKLDSLRWQSDRIGFLGANQEAEKLFVVLQSIIDEKPPQGEDDIHQAARAWVIASAKTVMQQWRTARAALDENGVLNRCHKMDDAVMAVRITTAAKPGFPKDVPPHRWVGTVIEKVVVQPTDTRLVVFTIGAVFGVFDDVPRHSLRDGLVATDSSTRRPLRPMAMLLARPAPIPVWAVVGIGTGAESIKNPDLFLGIATRIGGTPSKPLVTLGVGALHSSFSVALPPGAATGQPLPASIPKLEEALGMRGRWGLGITLALQGVDLFGKSKETKE